MSEVAKQTAPAYDPYPLDVLAVVRLVLIGVITGAVGWLLYLGIANFFIDPVFCRSAETYSVCRSGGTIAWIGAHVIVLAAATAVLARLAVYRPLLVVLATLVTLWGAHGWLGGMEWYVGLVWQAVLFGAAFAVFGWIARLPSFLLALILTLIVAVLSRIVLMLS